MRITMSAIIIEAKSVTITPKPFSSVLPTTATNKTGSLSITTDLPTYGAGRLCKISERGHSNGSHYDQLL